MSARLAWPSAVVAMVVLLIGTLAGCGGDHAAPKRTSTADEPVKTLTAGTCWGAQQLPEALGSKAFSTWVDKYARGDATLGDAMRDDAAFTEQVDCSAAHSLELYNVVELTPQLTGRITEYADLLDQKSELFRQVRDQV